MNPQHFTIMMPKIAQQMNNSMPTSQFPSHFSAEVHRMFGSDFFHILFITLLCSEMLFLFFPVQNQRLQRMITLAIGTLLGVTLIHQGSIVDAAIQGAFAGLSYIVIVHRFGSKKCVSSQCEKDVEKCIIPSHPEHL